MTAFQFEVNGLDISAEFDEVDIEEVFIPLLRNLTKLQKQQGRRIIAFLAAPPGSGKSTLVNYLEYLSRNTEGVKEIQGIGIDGFHYYNDYLNSHYVEKDGRQILMRSLKGTPCTFDVARLKDKLSKAVAEDVWWPLYSRQKHDPEEDMVYVHKDIIILEGNYLLSPEEPWCQLYEYCDYSIFMTIDRDVLKKRLIDRKVMGGTDPQAATDHFKLVDGPDIDYVLDNHVEADMTIMFDETNRIVKCEK